MKKVFSLLSFLLPVYLFSAYNCPTKFYQGENHTYFYLSSDFISVGSGNLSSYDVINNPNNFRSWTGQCGSYQGTNIAGCYFDHNYVCYHKDNPCQVGEVLQDDGTCLLTCPTGQHLENGECVLDCNFTAPSDISGYPLLGDFNTSEQALSYFQSNNIQNGYIQSASSLGAPDNCSGFYAYGQLPENDPCNNVQYELVVNGYPLQGLFTSYGNCVNYINNNHFGNGVCKIYGNCSKVFAYYKSDNNVSFFPDVNNTLPPENNYSSNNTNFDDNFTSPNYIDDNNDSVDMSPLLGQISQLSNNNHQDLKKLFDNQSQTNFKLGSLINLYSSSSNKLSSIKSNTKNTSDNTQRIADSVTGSFDSSAVVTTLNNAKDIFTFDDNQSSNDYNSSNVLSLYNDYSTKSENALTSLFDSIDFGINDIFTVQSYDFVDIPFPAIDIDILNLHLHGKLLDASFFNSLDFSLLKMFLMLLTLIWSAKYIFDRLFH